MPEIANLSSTDIKDLIDHRNQGLWANIIDSYSITIADSSNMEYGCYTKSNTATLFVPPKNICRGSFTHELLHIYIRLKEIYIGASLQSAIRQSNTLSTIFVPALQEHIGNCLDHIKMLPVYLELGFERENFLFDYGDMKCTDYEIKQIRNHYKKNNRHHVNAVGLYIGKYFAIQADPNPAFNYLNASSSLRDIDSDLFQILETFIESWKDFDINNRDILNSYYPIVSQFCDDLIEWTTVKKFV